MVQPLQIHCDKKFIENHNQIELIADIGAESASFSKELLKNDSKKRIIAIDTACKIESQDPELPNLEFRKCGIQFNADLYLFTDVIEHVENDLLFIKSYSDHAKKCIVFCFIAPCFMSLWSEHDVFLKH